MFVDGFERARWVWVQDDGFSLTLFSFFSHNTTMREQMQKKRKTQENKALPEVSKRGRQRERRTHTQCVCAFVKLQRGVYWSLVVCRIKPATPFLYLSLPKLDNKKTENGDRE